MKDGKKIGQLKQYFDKMDIEKRKFQEYDFLYLYLIYWLGRSLML